MLVEMLVFNKIVLMEIYLRFLTTATSSLKGQTTLVCLLPLFPFLASLALFRSPRLFVLLKNHCHKRTLRRMRRLIPLPRDRLLPCLQKFRLLLPARHLLRRPALPP